MILTGIKEAAERYPDAVRAVAKAGHEIGIHGYSHENPIAMTRAPDSSFASASPSMWSP